MEYVILMDVAGDIDNTLAKENGICFIPMEITIDGNSILYTGNEDEEFINDFYHGLKAGKLAVTSQITPYQYQEYFKPILKEHKSILYLCFSSGLTSTYQSALLAKKELEEKYPECEIEVVDTLSGTGGVGILCEKAIINRNNGLSLIENANDIREMTKKIRHLFVVEDLLYLKRGGRISSASAILGTTLKINPVLKMNEEGRLENVVVKRGNNAALKELLTRFNDEYDSISNSPIYITHSDNLLKAESLSDEIKNEFPAKTIKIHTLSPIPGAHTGPGVITIDFIGK